MDGDAANALEALRSNPDSPEALAEFLRAGEALARDKGWEEAARVFETALKTARRPAEQALAVALGNLYWQAAGDVTRAEAMFRRVRKLDPRDPAALTFYRAYYQDRDELPQLLNVLQQAQRAEEDEAARTRLGIEMAQVAELKPQTLEKAIDLWKGLLRKQPDLSEAVQALRRLYTETEKWNALTELLKEQVERLDDGQVDAKIALYQEMIPIYRDRMHLEVMVTSYYQAILKLKPDHRETLEALADSYEKKARYPDLVAVLARLAEIATDPDQAIALHRRVAALWSERLGKPQNAAAALEKVLALRPDDGEAQAALIDLYTKGRRWRELLELYQRLPALAEPERERERLAEMARLATERLGDARQAIAIWQRVLAGHPDDDEALAALAALHEREKDFRALADVLGRQAARAERDPAARAALLERQGLLLYEKLDALDEARPVLEALHALAPDNARALRALRELYGREGRYDALEALYAERGAYEELCEALLDLGERAQAAGDERAAIGLYERVAALATGKLSQPERAIKAYERILASDPGHPAATAALAELYRNTEKWSRLLESYELRLGGGEAAAADEPEPRERKDSRSGRDGGKGKGKRRKKPAQLPVAEQLAILAEARSLCEHKLGSKALAFKWAQRALALAPDDPALWSEVERLGEAAEEWSALADLYGRRLEKLDAAGAAEARVALLRKALRLHTARTRRPAEARRLADALLAAVPGDAEAEAALQGLLLAEERWPEVAELMQRRAARLEAEGGDPKARAELLVQLARLQEERLGLVPAAIETLRAALAVEPESERVLAALARLHENAGDADGLAEVIGRQAELERVPDAKIALTLRLARLHETRGSAAKARAAYLRVLDLDGGSPDAVAGLERALFEGGLGREEIPPVALRLARHYEASERFDRWAEALEALVSATDDEDERRKHLETLTGLYEDAIGDKNEAFGAALRVLQLRPADAPNRERLLRLAVEAGRLPDLARGIEDVLVVVDDPALRVELLTHLAEIEEKQAGHEAAAEKAYRLILDVDPVHPGATAALTRILRDGERWADLRALLEKREGHAADRKEKLALLAQIAEIDEALLGDREHAVGVLTRQLELQPDSRATYHALERLLTALGRWSSLARVLEQEAAIVPEAERTAVTFRRLEVLVEKLGNFDEALDILEGILKQDPDHEEATRLVERLLRKPKAKQRAASILGPIFHKKERWEGLVEVLQIRRAALQGGKALAALKKIAELQELKLADETGALATWQSVLELDPGNREALQAVERLSAMLERPEDLVTLYQDMAARKEPDDLRGRAELLMRAARLCVSSLGDRARAAALWQAVLDLDPTSVELGRPAAEALEALYPQIGAYDRLAAILEVKREWESAPAARAAIHVRIADLHERALRDPEAALLHLREAFDLTPDDVRLLDRLEPIHTARGEWLRVVEILERRLALATSQKARVELRWRIAELHEQRLQSLDEAIAMVQANLDESGGERAALDALDRLYDKKGAHEARLSTLERRLVLTDAQAERAVLLRKAGALLAGPLAQPREALEKWREVLLHAPDDADTVARIEALLGQDDELRRLAAETLEPIYEGRGDHAGLARLYAIYIETEVDRRARMRTWARLAELRRNRLGDQPGAFVAYGKAIQDALGEEEIVGLLDTYETLGATLGRQADVLALYQEIEPDVLRDDVRLRIARQIASAAMAAGDLDGARDRYLAILDQTPDDPGALSGLDRIYRQRGDDERLYELLIRRAELVSDDGIREFPLRVEAAALAQKLGRSDDAIVAYERALELRQQDPATLGELEKLYAQAERWVDLRELLERRLLLTATPAEEGALHARIARLEIDELGDRIAALEHLRQVLARQADHPEAIAALEALLADVETAVPAAELLEPVYARRGDWARLVAVHEVRRDQLETPADRAPWTRRIARIYEEQIEDLDQAFEWYGRLLSEAPGDRTVQEQLLRLSPKLNRWARLAQILEEYLYDELAETPEVLQVVRLAAWVQDERLADREAARKHYRRYLEAQPGNAEACALYERALERWEAWEDLRDLLDEQAAAASTSAARVALWRRSAALSETRLGDRARAAEVLGRILDEAPGDRAAASERERVLREERRWDDVVDHLRARLGVEPDAAEQTRIALRLAQVLQAEIGDVHAALDEYAELLAREPGQPEARAALEALLAQPDQRARAAEILEQAYRRTETFDRLAAVLRVRIELAGDTAERVALLEEAAALEERLGHVGEALEARGRVWLEDVADERALAALEAAVPAARAYERYVALLLEGSERAEDPGLRAALLARAAGVVEARLGDRARAIAIWTGVVQAQEDHDVAYRELARLQEAEGRLADLADTLERHARNVYEPALRIGLCKRLAILSEQALRDPARAVTAWSAVLESDDADADALDALARLHAAARRWRELAEITQRRIELAAAGGARDAGTLRMLRFTAARLHDEELGEPGEAVTQLRAVLDTHPGDGEALEALDRLLSRLGQHLELLEVLDTRARLSALPAERDTLAARAAQLARKELGDGSGAIERYRQILERSPDFRPAREALWELARDEEHRGMALPVLEPLLRAGGSPAELIELLELKLAGEDAPALRIAILGEMAALEEGGRRDLVRAFELWARAFAEDPADAEVRAALERVARARGDHRKLAALYEEAIGRSYDADLQRDLSLRLAALAEGELRDPERALKHLHKALEYGGDQPELLARVAALLRARGRWAELADTLARQVAASTDPAEQAALLCELGKLRGDKLDDRRGAFEAFRDALEREPAQEAALQALRGLLRVPDLQADVADVLEPLAEARGDRREQIALCEVRAGLERDPVAAAGWWQRAAELHETALGDAGAALAAYGKALAGDPESRELAEGVARAARAAGKPAQGARLLEGAAERLDGRARVGLYEEAAGLYQETTSADAQAAAERLYRRVLELDPEHASALAAIEKLCRARGDREALARVLEQRAAAELDARVQAALRAEAAALHEQRGDLEAAIASWEKARESDDSDPRALDALIRLYDREGDAERLVAVLEDRARLEDDPRRKANLYVRVAELRAGPLDDADAATLALREAMDIDPDHDAAFEALAALCEARARWTDLEEALLSRSTRVAGDARRLLLYRLAANAAEHLDDVDRAMGYLRQVLDEWPDDREAASELERLLAGAGRWHDLIELLESRAEAAARGGRKDGKEVERAARLRVAEIWAEELDAPDSACEAVEAILARDPGHLPSLIALGGLYARAGRRQEAMAALERAAAAGPTGRTAADLHVRLAQVRAEEGASDEVLRTHYLKAVDADRAHVGALRGLEALARKSGDAAQLAQVLELLERQAETPAARAALLRELAGLYTGPLRTPAAARPVLERLVALQPEDLEAREALGSALVRAGQVAEGEAMLGALLDALAKKRQMKAVARVRTALGLAAEQRGDGKAALEHLQAAFKIEPAQPPILVALGRVSEAAGDVPGAMRCYRALLLQSFDEGTAGLGKAEVYFALARLHIAAGESAKARGMYERGLELAPERADMRAALAALK